MKALSLRKRTLSLLMAMLTVIGCLSPALSALADDGVIGVYDIQIFYEDGTLVPTYQDDGESDYIVYLMEGVKQQFTYQFVDCSLPDNGRVKWTSDTPTVCDVTEDGIVRAFDSSKGAAVRLWLDNEVGTIPLVGSVMKSLLEKVLFNEYVDLDTMDTDTIVAIVEGAFGSDSVLGKYIDSYKGELVDSLREYLAKVNTKIYCTMYDSDGTQLAQDYICVCVTKSDAVYADFIPNGTHITNKQDLPTTVAKGSTLQLSACTTPTRLHMGVIYSVKSSSIFSNGKVVATVNDSGLVSFKNTGTVTILVSPDTDGFIENLLKYINYIYQIDNTGTIDSGKVADILINYIGLDINRTVLMGILDACFAIYDIVGDTADPVQLTATAVKIIANIIYQFTTNDSITFTVVEGVPLTYFDIGGASAVQEGAQIQLSIENTQPEAAITSDITWTSSDPSIAYVDPVTGAITGRDAGGSLGQFSSQPVEITATSAANNFSQTVTITVTGKTGINYISDVEITTDLDSINIGGDEYLHANVYPQRAAESELLYIYWGIVTGGSEEEGYEYSWASDPYQLTDEEGNLLYDENGDPLMADGTVTDGIGTIDKNGYYIATAGGNCMVACRAVTGYTLLTGSFYEISEVITTKVIENGQPVTGISLQATKTTSGGTLTIEDRVIDGKVYHYATVKKTVMDGLALNGCVIEATIEPSDATNKSLIWHLDNNDYYFDDKEDPNGTTRSVKMKAAVETASAVNVWCTSADGSIKSEVVTVTVTRNYATNNTIDGGDISITNGKTIDVTHTMQFNNGTFTGGAYAAYAANWYSSDEEVFSVESVDSHGNAVLRGNDVGVATLTCVSTDGAIIDTRTVTVYPDKSTMKSILDLCEKTVIHKTEDNAADYQTYMRRLDYCYYLYYDEPLPSQTTVDTYADDLLYIFYKIGGYVMLNNIKLADKDGNLTGDYLSVNVSSLNYKNTSYDLNYQLYPANCMYSNITWKSSNDSAVKVDKNGVCKPASNKSCYATITVSAKDYMGNEYNDSIVIAFAKTNVTGVSISPSSIVGGKAGETQQLTAKVSPSGLSGANISDVIWTSSDESVAKVKADGNVEFVYGGDCVITATTVDGGFVAECPVNVITNYDPLQELINTYTSLSLSVKNYYPDTYETFMATLDKAQKMIDANASTQNEVRAMCAELEAAYNGLKKYNYITDVEIYLDGDAASDYYQYDISIFKEGIFNSYKNAKLDLNVRLYPNNASYYSVVWESDSDVIEVSQSGVCTINQNTSCYGKITCTVTDHFGNSWTDDVWVSFAMYPVTGVTLSETDITGSIGDTHQLVPTISPTGASLTHIGSASITDVVWSSDDENIATVDENGLVTFVNAGATKVRITTLDGGYTAECIVSTEGNRAKLIELLDKYADVNYMDYKYNVGMNFKSAYEEAQRAREDNSYTQAQIDAAADALDAAAYALEGNAFNYAETISLNAKYESWSAFGGWSTKTTGSLSNDATAVSQEAYSSNYTQSTRIILTGSVYPTSSDYVSVAWSVLSKTNDTSVTINGTSVTVNPSASTNAAICTKSAQATLLCTATDAYGRTISRAINVVVAQKVVTGIALDQTNVTAHSDSAAFKLNATVSPSDAKVKDVIWSSSNPNVATVDQNGNVTPINNGKCTITAETFDGGYRAECQVNLVSNFNTLANLYAQYMQFVNEVQEEHIYTTTSLSALQEALAQSKTMIEEATASQQEVNAMVDRLRAAYDGLVKLVAVQKINVEIPEQNNVSEPNPGFVRYSATSISGGSFYFNVSTYPQDSTYDTITYECDNPNITVTEYGIVTKSTGTSNEYGKITVTTTDEAGNSCSTSFYAVFVRIAATGVSVDNDVVFGAPQEQAKLSPKVSSSSNLVSASISACIYESAHPEVASVDENGMVTFNTQGETTITIRTVDGGYSTTVKAYTTWDSTALTAAINQYASVDYTAYAYEYGTAFHSAYEAAVAVRDNHASSQTEIDNALTALQTAYNNLAGHEFVYIGTPALAIGGVTVENGANFAVDENNQVVVNAVYNDGAMVKSQSFTYENENGVTAQEIGGALVITKTGEAAGSIDVTFTAVDDYGREETVTKTIRIVNVILPISDFKFTYNGEEVSTVEYKATIITNRTVQLGINIYPEDAEAYKSVSWSSSNSTITVDENGLVKMGTGSLTTKTYSAIITCTVELNDGTTITHTIQVTFTRG